ncbi:hypothetical protein GALMADRAFT_143491 [Galerina marginata CBS 339.88]|uniref:Uncharacterized protein n=1 Tax=Galerina marginata (strain CBS 339.88) TaxID=685588 RepID=A0A067SL96_GALM3|nr:hypothetical protein GALMADRAFT_143491 [Galerina marginata CBS 339.88]
MRLPCQPNRGSERECRLRDDTRILAFCQPPHIAFQLVAHTWEATMAVVGGGIQRFGVAFTPLSPPDPADASTADSNPCVARFRLPHFARSLVKPNRSTTTSPPPPIASTNDPPDRSTRRRASSPHVSVVACGNADEPTHLRWLTSSPA